ncbi:amidohydrolase family protein [Roseateles asaccharophilus]|uniref:Enamidase n=1 Tax=Roseateles asaccharophilus TaxID=582607 RepID=A0ABU2A296_9BURK|nr:amidohydrolase family protein [Roseateles asaccharophilus]MDR7331210.1 enamidase [Roseateles asaccharophilus]
MKMPLATLTLAFAAQAVAQTPQPSDTERYTLFHAPVTLLRNAQLFDGTGSAPRAGMSVLIRDGRIADVKPDAELKAPAGALVKDLAGGALMPGFVLLHEHLFYPTEKGSYGAFFQSFPLLYLAGGVTTMRTAGSMSPYADLNTWKDIKAGTAPGPDIDVTAPFLNGIQAFVAQVPRLASPDDAVHQVRYWADIGATSYKGYMHLSREQLAAIVKAAHERQAKVTAHLCAVTYTEAAAMGIDNLEHGFFAASDFVDGKQPDACPTGDAVPRSLDALAADDPRMAALQQQLIARKVALTSTLTVFETFSHGRPMAPAGALDLLMPQLREQYVLRYTAIQRGGPNTYGRVLPKAMAWEKRFADAGGLLVAGTDPTGYGGVIPGFSSLRQFELLREAGFDAAATVKVMTANGAQYLGRSADVGRIAPGLRADLIAFAAPLDAAKPALPDVAWTMKAGRAWDRARILNAWKGQVGLR